jgi:phenylpropionate dioxygenase-like ring-hydroxylating dioxygenase large terminal subunit
MLSNGFGTLVEEGRVKRDVYVRPDVFEAEMRSIFGRAWVYVGHTSEIAEAGDYKRAAVGSVPVIVSRDDDENVHVLLNRCRHRGATVCQRDRGNARHFRCRYHGWTYTCDGRLTGVPFSHGYGSNFSKEEMGLVPVRTASYRGFIWATLWDDAPPLEDYLGKATEFIDEFCAPSPVGEIQLVSGAQRYGFDGNWKLQMENSVDGYHPNFVHHSFAVALKETRREVETNADFNDLYKESSPTKSLDLGNGHSVLDQRVYGPVTADERDGGGFNLLVFPNLVIIGAQVRTIVPIAWNRTEVIVQPVTYVGLEDLTPQRLRTHEFFYGPAGFGQPDDAEMFRRVWEGLTAWPDEWVDISRGLQRERVEDGIRVGHMTDELGQRAFYRMWRELISAG